MTLNDEDLKRIFQAHVAKQEPKTRQDCPSFHELARFFEPGPRRRQKLKIVDHVTNCSACSQEFEFLRELQSYERRLAHGAAEHRTNSEGRPAPARIQRGWILFRRYAPIAAGTIVLMISLAILVKWDRTEETRSASRSVVLLRPRQDQTARLTVAFEWKPVESADSYIFEIFDETLLPVWASQPMTSTFFIPPEELRNRLRSNAPYYWMITAFRNKNKLAESELRRVILSFQTP